MVTKGEVIGAVASPVIADAAVVWRRDASWTRPFALSERFTFSKMPK
tara:strand:+ start:456 stop:596 length:141 start_codon:yes stop_codon:yes gene_type:complete